MSTPVDYTKPHAITTAASFTSRVYNWMTLGLALTGLVAYYFSSNPALMQKVFQTPGVFIGLIIAELGLVLGLSWGIGRMSAVTATIMFLIYSAISGATFSVIFLAYTRESIASTFFITAATFGATSLYGYVTKRDLTSLGGFLLMGLIGLIIASVVNLFLNSPAIYWAITYIGILIFVGLTAYDTQRIKTMQAQGFANAEAQSKASIIMALQLYLDFINLFLMLLRLTGNRR